MNTGAQFFPLSWQQYVALAVLLLAYLLLAFKNKLPSMVAFKDFADVINSAGGNIILLAAFAAVALKISMQFFYYILALPADAFTKQQGIITAGIAFVTGSVFGTFSGALIKTLTGGKANGVTTPPPPTATQLLPSLVPVDPKKGT
jgi:hypothetical protein